MLERLFPVKAPDADLDGPTQRFPGGPFVLDGPMEPKS
jgi:uronate dehydrogenase